MRRVMILFSLIAFLGITLTACVYHAPVQQGNVITDKDLKSLHKGMTKSQVRSTLGSPVLVNIYADNRMVYVYTFQPGHEKMQSTRLIIYLHRNHVISFWTDKYKPNQPVSLPNPK